MDFQQFEKDFVEICKKNKVPQTVLIYRDGGDVRLVSGASSAMDQVTVDVLEEYVRNAVNDSKPAIQKAMEKQLASRLAEVTAFMRSDEGKEAFEKFKEVLRHSSSPEELRKAIISIHDSICKKLYKGHQPTPEQRESAYEFIQKAASEVN